jgi:diguanylate cyclase (GGDEF)-like protein/putative nucleotidyltransferase with HDIG domain
LAALPEANNPSAMQKYLTPRSLALIGPVIVAGLVAALLFLAVDRSQPISVAASIMGVALLGVVLARQLGSIMDLEGQVAAQGRQIEVVSEVVSALNSSPNVGGTLGEALEKLVGALQADAGAIWLPGPSEGDPNVLVEQRGLAGPEEEQTLLGAISEACAASGERLLLHPVSPGARHHNCVTVRMGRPGEEFGYLTMLKRSGAFRHSDGAVLSAVGSDIAAALRSIRMISEARKLADRDPVTGLHNHRSAYQRLHAETERHKRDEKPFAVLMLDLDNFKLFNDTYGHPAGDEVLKRVAAVLRRSCRETDTVARYGGDEFFVLLPETTLKAAIRCAERIQTALGKERFRYRDSEPLPIGFSYGISVFPDDSKDPQELVSVADSNLYESKTQGGNRITVRGRESLESTLSGIAGLDLFGALLTAIDNKDGYTRKHSEEVTEYSVQIARALGLPPATLETVRVSGLLHDVGKIGVPDAVLRKPGRLEPEEFELMKQHPVFGALIVGAIPEMEEVVLGVRSHHERYDGRGYPDGLVGEEIPLIGRIMAVADAFSAMTTSRPYRKGLSEPQALDEIMRGLGSQFDPAVGALFVQLRREAAAPAPVSAAKPRAPRKRKVAAEAAPAPADL